MNILRNKKSENVKMSKEKSYNQQNNSTTYLQMKKKNLQ